MRRSSVEQQVESAPTKRAATIPVTISPAGRSERLNWRAVAGATGVRVRQASIRIAPATASGRNLGIAATGRSNVTSIDARSPEPGTRIRSIRIPNLRRHEGGVGIAIGSQSSLGDHRLVVAPIIAGVVQAPIVAVPEIRGRNALPAQLTGGSLGGAVLNLPDVVGDRFLITLVTGSAPDEFESKPISFSDVTMRAAPEPVGLHVEGPDGAELFALAGPITAPVTVDLKAALERHFNASIADSSLEGTFTVKSDIQGSAALSLSAFGHVERKIDERLSVDAEGAPVVIEVPEPQPDRAPNSTIADVTVVHHGMALHPLSDAVPEQSADLGGPVVRDQPLTRQFPPDALHGQRIRRVAVIGWPLADCDLRLEVLGQNATVEELKAPEGRSRASVVWFDFEEGVVVEQTLRVALTATRGAFGWVANPEPRVRFAVAVSPNGERVNVGGAIINLIADETLTTGAELQGSAAWPVVTDQFCTVSLSNAVMEFAP